MAEFQLYVLPLHWLLLAFLLPVSLIVSLPTSNSTITRRPRKRAQKSHSPLSPSLAVIHTEATIAERSTFGARRHLLDMNGCSIHAMNVPGDGRWIDGPAVADRCLAVEWHGRFLIGMNLIPNISATDSRVLYRLSRRNAKPSSMNRWMSG